MPMTQDKQQPAGVSIHTGFPNPATDTRLHTLDFNQLLIEHTASTFMFRIRGNEWQKEGIHDGDIAIVDRALDAHRNDIVVWWHESASEFAISRLTNMPKNATIWGVITATIHQFRTHGTLAAKKKAK